MSIHRRFAPILLASLLSAACTYAQQTDQQTAQPPAGKITLDVVVTPRSGEPVAGLQAQDFTLFDNKTARTISSFRPLGRGQDPVEVILVVDAVNAAYQTVAYARPQIEKFLRADGGHLPYPTTLAVVTDAGTQIQKGFSSDGNALRNALDRYDVGLRTIRRDTGFYGAEERLQLSLQALQSLAAREAARPGRKIILWISPGWPLLSGPNVDLAAKEQQQLFSEIVHLSTQLRQTRTTLYSIDPLGAGEGVMRVNYYQTFLKGVEKPRQVQLGDLGLQVLATQTGGLALASSNDLTALLQRAMADTSAYYELTFDPPPAEHPDEYHHLQIQLARPGLTARTLRGYYAQPSLSSAAPPQ
ncbi:MAG TPA: VWA domain-containing protein [Granulicella sp.]|jgi:VWFA-related protein|nr:VWA domain-containing protein [Granulicella sp.]